MPFMVASGQFSGVLEEMRAAPAYATWPQHWRHGMASAIRMPAAGAWTAPEAIGPIRNNLLSMVARIERGISEQLLRSRGFVGGLAEYRRTGHLDVMAAERMGLK